MPASDLKSIDSDVRPSLPRGRPPIEAIEREIWERKKEEIRLQQEVWDLLHPKQISRKLYSNKSDGLPNFKTEVKIQHDGVIRLSDLLFKAAEVHNVNLYDGRTLSPWVENAYRDQYHTKPSTELSNDGVDVSGRYELRQVTVKEQVHFASSGDMGKGRKSTFQSANEKLSLIENYIIVDCRNLSTPEVPFYRVPAPLVKTWLDNNQISKSLRLDWKKFANLFFQYQNEEV